MVLRVAPAGWPIYRRVAWRLVLRDTLFLGGLTGGRWMKAVRLPFNISCGHSKNCERGLVAYCLRANVPDTADASLGFADMALPGTGFFQ